MFMLLQDIIDKYVCGERHTDDQVAEDAVVVAVVVSDDQAVQHDDQVGEDAEIVMEMTKSLQHAHRYQSGASADRSEQSDATRNT